MIGLKLTFNVFQGGERPRDRSCSNVTAQMLEKIHSSALSWPVLTGGHFLDDNTNILD